MSYSTTVDKFQGYTLTELPEEPESGQGGTLMDVVVSYLSTTNIEEYSLGESFEATFLDDNGLPLSGTGTIFRGEEPLSQGQVSGDVKLPGPVPSGVVSGENVLDSDPLNFVFEPSITGINFVRENYTNNPVGEVQYGTITGTVTDVDGDPVPDDSIEAVGLVAITDENGEYELVGPGGSETALSVAGTTESVSITGGTTTNINFSYSRLIVRVLAPDNSPVRGAKVSINNKKIETDESGRATIPLAPTQEYDIRLGEFQTQETITQSGRTVEVTIGNRASGVKLTVTDSESGETVGGTTVQIGGSGVVSRTKPNGEASSIGESEGTTAVLVGEGDRRYVKRQLAADLARGEVFRAEVELERKNNTPTI